MTTHVVRRQPTGVLAVLLAVFLIVTAGACGVSEQEAPDLAVDVQRHIDAFKSFDTIGDDPGSPRQQEAIQYAKGYLESLGLKTQLHETPLVRMHSTKTTLLVSGPNGRGLQTNSISDNFIVWPGRQAEEVTLDAGVIFAGYGVVSPEYNRDDYQFVDATGKIVLVLDGWPHSTGRDDLGVLGSSYYGTPQYKFTEAARQGAAGVLIINGDVEMPWAERQEESRKSIVDIRAAEKGSNDAAQAQIEGWLTQSAAAQLFALAGRNFETESRRAIDLSFQALELEQVNLNLEMTSVIETYASQDVLAVLPGAPSESGYVMLAGRWNRLDPDIWHEFVPQQRAKNPIRQRVETREDREDERRDDGSGAALVMEAARRLVAEDTRPIRSIVFMVATALEPGIIGLEHFVEHAPKSLPADQLAAMVFLDHGHSEGTSPVVGKIGTESDNALSQIARGAAAEQGRLLELDDRRKRHIYYQFAQTALVKDGVRTLYLTTPPRADATARTLKYLALRDGVVGLSLPTATRAPVGPTRDATLLANIIRRVANSTNWPPRIDPVVIAR